MGAFLERYRSLVGDGISRTLIKGATGFAGARLGGKALGFGLQLLLANLLGAAGYGQYVYPLSWMSLLILLALVGLDTTTLRYVPNYLASESWSRVKGLLLHVGRRVLTSAVGVAVFAAATVWWLRGRLDPGLAPVFWAMCLLLIVKAPLQLYSTALRALKRVFLSELSVSVVIPSVLGAAVVLLYLLIPDYLTATLVMTLHAGAALFALGVVVYLLGRELPSDVMEVEPSFDEREEWHRVGWALLLVSASHLLLARADVLMVGIFVGVTEAGIYEVASRLTEAVGFGLLAANSIVAPLISEMYEKGEREKLQQLLTLSARGVLALALPAVVFLAIWGSPVLGWFGDAFTRGYGVLLLLAAGQLMHVLAGSVGFVMIMTEHHRESAVIIGGSAIVNIALNLWFIHLWGFEGAAIATATTTVLWNVALLRYVWVHLELNTTAFGEGIAFR